MTLLISEIHAIDSLQNSFILNVADRRLTDKDTGEWHGNHRKIFEIPYLNAGVGYFGVAAVSNKVIWDELDKFLYGMFAFESFSSPKTQTEMEEVAKWKLSVIASFYKKFARRKLIGTPIDAFILLPK